MEGDRALAGLIGEFQTSGRPRVFNTCIHACTAYTPTQRAHTQICDLICEEMKDDTTRGERTQNWIAESGVIEWVWSFGVAG